MGGLLSNSCFDKFEKNKREGNSGKSKFYVLAEGGKSIKDRRRA